MKTQPLTVLLRKQLLRKCLKISTNKYMIELTLIKL